MALGTGLAQAATVAQLIGVDVGGNISMIMQGVLILCTCYYTVMALWTYYTAIALWTWPGQAATVAHRIGIIFMIMKAEATARQNKECDKLARPVFKIAELLPHLQYPEVMQRPEARQGDTLWEALELVMSWLGRSTLYELVFSIISLLPNDTSVTSAAGFQSQLEAAEVPQEVVPLPHGVGAEEFTFAELAAATNNFAPDTVIAERFSSTVYKGRLHDRREVAIKRMTTELSAEEFRSEMAILSPLHHKHIVRLFGWSVQNEERRLLVFEYMNNGTLYDHLHRQTSSSSPVTTSWEMRIKILLGVSRAIEHLHCSAVPRVIHRDIKSSNILLDAKWVPRVSGFGLSVTPVGHACRNLVPRVPIICTPGYLDPEYSRTGCVKPTIDVYSLGVVMLEVLTGKKAFINWKEEESKPSVPRTGGIAGGSEPSDPLTSLVIFALQFIEAGELGKVLDRRPAVPEPTPRQLEAAKLVAHTAARCLQLQGEDRPAISDVVADLQTALELVRCGE